MQIGQFLKVLESVAWKLGKRVIKVDPSGTSQYCLNCLNRVSKELSERWHSCSNCGEELDRDYNWAKLIKKLGLLIIQGEGITSVKTAAIFLAEESRALS
ncbi:MAG: zinc ribbon domain-containing protein [Xenococcaceae cyanobacterium]